MFSFSIWLTIYVGFMHAFEADHILAVSNIVSQRNSIVQSIKDGAVWGLGHATTIVLIGIFALFLKIKISPSYIHYLEALVGVMLIVLGVYRIVQCKKLIFKTNAALLTNSSKSDATKNTHGLSYGIGFIHGLAGSGELVLLTMLQCKNAQTAIAYLIIFATGAIAGMMVAAALCSIPFYKKIVSAKKMQMMLKMASAIVCVLYGVFVLYKNVMV